MTTYNIAPAAKLKKNGNTRVTFITSMAPIIAANTSTIPDKDPIIKLFILLYPDLLNGILIAAPSGKFWIAIPIVNDIAEAIDTLGNILAEEKATPTARPSGMLHLVHFYFYVFNGC